MNRLDSVGYGFGVGAVGLEPAEALHRLGEMVVVRRIALWTPAGQERPKARMEAPGAIIQSPFMVHWDGRVNAAYRFDHRTGIRLDAILRGVFESLDQVLPSPAEAASVMLLARTGPNQVRDQVVIERMTPDNAPPAGGLIADPPHRDRFFSRDTVLGTWPDEQSVTLLALALVLDASRRRSAQGSFERAFWPVRDPRSVEGLQLHCHAAVTPRSDVPLDDPGASVDDLGRSLLSVAQSAGEPAVVHLMPDTELRQGVIAVGLPAGG